MIVYGRSLAPSVRKVLAFAAEKQIAVETRVAGLGLGGPEFFAASPFKTIPALRAGDFTLAESSAIIAYFDALRPEPNLIPTAPQERARTIWYQAFADNQLMGVIPKIFFNRFVAPRMIGKLGDLELAARAEAELLPPLVDYLEGQLPDSGFLVEDRLTLADIAVANPFANLQHLGWTADRDRHPRTAAYLTAILSRPAFADLLEAERAFMAAPPARPGAVD